MEDIQEIESMSATILPLGKEYDEIADVFQKSYKSEDVCISAIFKMTNGNLEYRFQKLCDEIEAKRKVKPKVMRMFHGTTKTAAKNIAVTGFDPAFCTVAAFGKGTYASPHVHTALGYCKDAHSMGKTSMVFLCKFVLGTYGHPTVGNMIDTKLYDHSGDGRNIYVTPYADGIIPEYLICYYAWDKRGNTQQIDQNLDQFGNIKTKTRRSKKNAGFNFGNP